MPKIVPRRPQKPKAGVIPTKLYGKTGVNVQIIAQGGARMDLHPTVAEAAAHVRRVYDLGLAYFDCARSYWGGKSEEARLKSKWSVGLGGHVELDDVITHIGSDSKIITVENVAPVATINGAPISSDEGTLISLTSSVSDAGSLDTFQMFFGDVMTTDEAMARLAPVAKSRTA